MHPTLMQDLARQRTAAIDREADDRRLVAIARSTARAERGHRASGHLRRLALAAVRLRLAVRGSAA